MAKETERLSLSNVELVESDVESGLVGRPWPSSMKCEFYDLCDSGSDVEDSSLQLDFPLALSQSCDYFSQKQ